MAKYQYGPLLKSILTNLFLFTLAVVLWVLLYISGCSLLSNLPAGSVAVMLYILGLWFMAPLVFIFVCRQRLMKHQGRKAKPHHYGLLFCAGFFLWLLLALIMGLGPCYRYYVAGINIFGEALFNFITLPLLIIDAVYRATSLSFPLLVLLALTIVFSLGLLPGCLKSILAEKYKQLPK